MLKFTTADKEYEKNKNISRDDVKSLLEWVEQQHHLPKLTELDALLFLSCYKGSKEMAKRLLDLYYTSRTHCPEIYSNRHPEKIKDTMEVAIYYPLEVPNDYDRTLFLGIHDPEPSKFNMEYMCKLVGMCIDLLIQTEGVTSNLQFIVDMSPVQLGHVVRLNPNTMKKALFFVQETLPINISRIHVVNVIPLAETILNIAKPFIKGDLLHKIIFHTEGIHTVYKYIPKECLPKNLGGNGPSVNEMHDFMKDWVTNNTKYFAEEELKRVDEKKRIGKQKNSSDIFGIDGSFKKLDID